MKYIFLFLLLPLCTWAQLPDSLLSIVSYQGMPSGLIIHDIVVTQSNAKYVATNKGIYRITDKNESAELLKEGNYTALCTNRKEKVFAMRANVLSSMEGPIISLDNNIVCNQIMYHRGNIWVASNSGVYKVNIKTGRMVANYSTRNSKMKADNVNFIFADPQDQLWIGTDSGLCLINKKGNWKVFEKNRVMESMTYNKEGIWLITDKEMWVIDDFGRWYPAALNKGLKEGVVRDITTDKDGRLVLASNVLVRYNPYIEEIHSYTNELSFLSKQTNAIEGDLNQDIWIGTETDGMYLLSFGDTKTLELSALLSIQQKISCVGSNTGKIAVKAYGGKAPYKYSWNDKSISGSTGRELKEGTYAVTVTDKINNTFRTEIYLDNPYPLNLGFEEIKGITEAGKSNGYAKLSISGGVLPYSFEWDNGKTEQENSELSAGEHSITITDADGCKVTAIFEIPAEKFIPQLDLAKIEVGQTLKVNQLFFDADSSSLKTDFEPILNEIFSFLRKNPTVVIEIGGHTNNLPPKEICDRLSNSRAKSIAEYLYRKGIDSQRISYKGYGKEKPIADNDSLAGRKKNQRVEIKILSI